jgi:phosphate-selective porin OprO/OprP
VSDKKFSKALSAAALGTFAILPSAGAQADTASEIRLLKARLHQLETQVARQHRETNELARTNVANAARVKNGASSPLPVFVDVSRGLKVESEDHAYSFRIGGRIYVDGGLSSQPERGVFGLANISQARLQVEGKAARIWQYKFQYDFAGSNTNTVGAIGGIRDAYLLLKTPLLATPYTKDPVAIQVGNFYEPFGLERTQSKNYVDFIERSLAGDTFGPSRHIGVAALAHGENWSAKGGVFSTSPEDKAQTPAAANGTPWWVNKAAGWTSTGGAQYFDVTGRITYAPIYEQDRLLHVGLSGRYHRPNSSTAANDDRVLALGANTNSESNVLKENLLGTPDLSCGTTALNLGAVASAGRCVRDVLAYGAEFSGAYGPFAVQAEYNGAHYNRDNQSILLASATGNFAPGGSSLNFDGYYVYGTWFLTGESRAAAYQVDDSNPGNFRQIKINDPFSAGGYGAWELGARFSAVNLNNGPFQGSAYANLLAFAPNARTRTYVANAGVLGGRQEDVTVGVNWYPDTGVRVMANWTRVVSLSAPYDRAYLNGTHPNTFLLRTQVDW